MGATDGRQIGEIMRVRTVAVGGAVVLALGYAGLQVATPRAAPSSSQEMAKPRKYKLQDGRAVVVLQLCWYPSAKAQVDVGYALGQAVGLNYDRVGPPLNCQTPWQRKAVLDPGARVTLAWTLNLGPVSKFRYRVTVNNRPRIEGEETASARVYTCFIGSPPCELP